MPVDIVGGVIAFLQTNVPDIGELWEGEIPRSDSRGVVIDVDAGPVFAVDMSEGGLATMPEGETFENQFTDKGPITVFVWATTRAVVMKQLNLIDGYMVQSLVWPQMTLEFPDILKSCLRERWTCVQEMGARSRTVQLIYRGELQYQVMLGYILPTR